MTTSSPLWRHNSELVDYQEAVDFMENHMHSIRADQAQELIWSLQHPPIFTSGTSAKPEHLFNALGFPVYQTGRGGQYTYHGPGQLVVYVMLDLEKRKKDIRHYVNTIEEWIIKALSTFNIKAEQRQERIGLWVNGKNNTEEKIAAIGIRITKWVTWHGFSINVSPNLNHFQGIVPCGLKDYGVTSLEKLGVKISLEEMRVALEKNSPF